MAVLASNLELHSLNILPVIGLTSPITITDASEDVKNLVLISSPAGNLFTLDNYGIAKFVSLGDIGHNWYLLGNIDATDATFNRISTPDLFVQTIYGEAGAGHDTVNLVGKLTVTDKIQGNAVDNSLPNQTLSVSDNTRILTQKTSARDDMWSYWQKKRLVYASPVASGTGFGTSGGQTNIGVICGTANTGRAASFYEGGMTLNSGQGAAWSIPSSFAIGFGFYGLHTNMVYTSNNITNGSNTFTVNTASGLILGHQIYSSAFPEETYISAINGTSITVTKNASATPSTPHTVVFAPDQISRFVLGTTANIARFILECPNLSFSWQSQNTVAAGDTSVKLYAEGSQQYAGTVAYWNGQPYIISTIANSNISNTNANFYFAGTGFPSVVINVLRIDNVVGTPTTTTGTWTGPTNQIVVASATNIVSGQTVSGLGIPHNTTVSSVAGTTVTLNQSISSSGSGVNVYFGYQRVYLDQSAVATATAQNAGFVSKTYLNQYLYGRGIPNGTTITSIVNYTSTIFTFNLSQAFTKSCITGLTFGMNFTADNTFTQNNSIFMDYGADPADGYLKLRLGYMLNGLITYSAWTPFPLGNIPNNTYNFQYQAVIDYDAATGKLRLFADRNGAIISSGGPRDWPKPPTTPTIEMTGLSGLNNKQTGPQFCAQIYGNNVNTFGNTTSASLNIRDATYYPYQTFTD